MSQLAKQEQQLKQLQQAIQDKHNQIIHKSHELRAKQKLNEYLAPVTHQYEEYVHHDRDDKHRQLEALQRLRRHIQDNQSQSQSQSQSQNNNKKTKTADEREVMQAIRRIRSELKENEMK